MNIFRKIRASLRLREAVRQADEKHKETGERYYVMPAGGKKGQLIIMDRKNFRKLKQKGSSIIIRLWATLNANASTARLMETVQLCFLLLLLH